MPSINLTENPKHRRFRCVIQENRILTRHEFLFDGPDLKILDFLLSVLILLYSELKENVFTKLDLVDFYSLADNALTDMPRHVLRHLPHVKTLDIARNKIAKLTLEDFQVTIDC